MPAVIADVRSCSFEEFRRQIGYLEATPVRGIAELLRTGRCTLKRGIVRSLAQLGALKTEFGQIGVLLPPAMHGERKFRVREVAPVLRSNPEVDEGGLLREIDAFIEKDERGEVQYDVTIFRQGTDLVVKDGNKRTIAFYERRKGSSDEIEFPVFIVEPAEHGA